MAGILGRPAFLLGVLCCLRFSLAAKYASVIINSETQELTLMDGWVVTNWVARGNFTNETNKTGWSYLEVSTNPEQEDSHQAYAAGLVEGYLTKALIDMHWANTVAGYCDENSPKEVSHYCEKLTDYLNKNMEWVYDQITTSKLKSDLWQQVERFYNQFAGLEDGYRGTVSEPRIKIKNPLGLFLIQVSGDIEDLETILKRPDLFKKKVLGSGSCSALIKVLPGNKDLYVSQDTWSGYNTMLRILKKYNIPYKDVNKKVVPGNTMTFSSYPGSLMSGDDFYVINSGLVSLETTIGNSNGSLSVNIKPTTLLEVVRCMVANRLALSGKQWSSVFSEFNSGTYNNQWMIVDYKQFKPGQPIGDDVLWVLEQIPGIIVHADVSDVLRKQQYWPSYNVAYFPKIFNMSGQAEMVAKHGDWFSYDHTARANIFRRDHIKVHDVDSMLKLMRYNDYTNDPLSRCNCTPPYSAENAISARCDLNPASGKYPIEALGHRSHGGTDCKITTYEMSMTLEFVSIYGPTYDSLPPFRWSTSDFKDSVPHVGHPDLLKFDPIIHKWSNDL